MPYRPVLDHDELRTGGERRRSHATGRRELSLQAHTTGQAAGGHRQGLQPSESGRKRILPRGERKGAGDVPADRSGRRLGNLRAAVRGIRDGQGTYSPRAARAEPPEEQAVCGGGLRLHPRGAGRLRVLRPPQGGVHRCRQRQGGTASGSRRRHAVPGRDRQPLL